MTGSNVPPAWRAFLQRRLPFLFSVCPGHNYHWWWDDVCRCTSGYDNQYVRVGPVWKRGWAKHTQ
jgi:hypothetical protein